MADRHRIYSMPVSAVWPAYVNKLQRKGRTEDELIRVVRWLTGYDTRKLTALLRKGTDLETFFAEAPCMNPDRILITGSICGVRVEEIKEPTMQAIRYLDKLVDELAKGRPMEKVLRSRKENP